MMRVLVLLFLLVIPARAQDTLRVGTLNIWHDQRDWPHRLALIQAQAEGLQLDVLFLQEVLQKEGLRNQAEAISEALGLSYVHFVSTDPEGQVHRYGNAILSRIPFTRTEGHFLVPRDAFRTVALAEIEVGAHTVVLANTHLHHESNDEGGAIRAMQMHDVQLAIERWASTYPVILGGDFNAEPHALAMRMMAGWRDAWLIASPDALGATFGPAYYENAPPRRIDYLFDRNDPRLRLVGVRRAFDQPDAQNRYPSDHLGLVATYVLY